MRELENALKAFWREDVPSSKKLKLPESFSGSRESKLPAATLLSCERGVVAQSTHDQNPSCWWFVHSSYYSIFCPVNIKFIWEIFHYCYNPNLSSIMMQKSNNISVTSKQLLLQHANMLFSASLLNLCKTVGNSSYYLLSAFPFFSEGINYTALVMSVVLRYSDMWWWNLVWFPEKYRNASLQLWSNCCKEHPKDKSSQKASFSLWIQLTKMFLICILQKHSNASSRCQFAHQNIRAKQNTLPCIKPAYKKQFCNFYSNRSGKKMSIQTP